jgi:hypothetical protein
MSLLAAKIEPYKRRSRRYRNHATDAAAQGQHEVAREHFTRAADTLREAIDYLNGLGAPDPRPAAPASDHEVELAQQLADCWGILGGVYRAAGELSAARDAYDCGAGYETSPRFGILNTYNQVNRLVVRVMERPELLSPAAVDVDMPGRETAHMAQLLRETGDEIERQLREGRADRPWALADLAMVRLLAGQPGVESALAALAESSANDVFPFESTLKVVRELAGRSLSMQDRLVEVGEWLRMRLPEHLRGEQIGPAPLP